VHNSFEPTSLKAPSFSSKFDIISGLTHTPPYIHRALEVLLLSIQSRALVNLNKKLDSILRQLFNSECNKAFYHGSKDILLKRVWNDAHTFKPAHNLSQADTDCVWAWKILCDGPKLFFQWQYLHCGSISIATPLSRVNSNLIIIFKIRIVLVYCLQVFDQTS